MTDLRLANGCDLNMAKAMDHKWVSQDLVVAVVLAGFLDYPRLAGHRSATGRDPIIARVTDLDDISQHAVIAFQAASLDYYRLARRYW